MLLTLSSRSSIERHLEKLLKILFGKSKLFFYLGYLSSRSSIERHLDIYYETTTDSGCIFQVALQLSGI